MATIKISDLSVGDWVNVMTEKLTSLVFCEEIEITRGYIHSQIKGIREDGYIAVEAADSRYTLVNIGCIEPIPITAEILEKNGFEIDSSCWRIYRDGGGHIEIWEDEGEWNLRVDSEKYLLWNLHWVHQIQHLMRVWRVDKEINL